MSSQIYNCDSCDKIYSSYMGLWKHKKSIHKKIEVINDEQEQKDEMKKHICKYCTKEFGDRTARWRHEKKYCKLNSPEITVKILIVIIQIVIILSIAIIQLLIAV